MMLYGENLKTPLQEIRKLQAGDDRETDIAIEKQKGELSSRRQSWDTIQAVYDVEMPPPTYLLRRGNHETPGHEVTPGFLRVLADSESKAALDGGTLQ